MSQLSEKIALSERKIARLKKEREEREDKYREDLKKVANYPAMISEIEGRRDTYLRANDWALGNVQTELDGLKEQAVLVGLIEDKKRAAAAQEQKDLALSKWIAKGGEKREFEAAWPTMRNEMIKNQVLAEMAADSPQPSPEKPLISGL